MPCTENQYMYTDLLVSKSIKEKELQILSEKNYLYLRGGNYFTASSQSNVVEMGLQHTHQTLKKVLLKFNS